MLLSVKHLLSYKIEATDGQIGRVYTFLMDDEQWIVRYLVVDTGDWLPDKKVLITPSAIEDPDSRAKRLPVRLSKKQIEESPDIDTDMPVSRKEEIKLHKHYNWSPYWAGVYIPVGAPIVPLPPGLVTREENKELKDTEAVENTDPHLRSTKEILNYKILAEDGEIGHMEDFIVDIESWFIRYMVVDTKNWLPAKKVILSPDWIHDVSWKDTCVTVSLPKAAIESSPEYDPSAPINMEYEVRLYDYYGRPKYWI